MLSRNKVSEGISDSLWIATERTLFEPNISQNRKNRSQKSGGFGTVSRIAD